MVKWYQQANRVPLILRGARQVGKTWLMREFAKSTGRTLIEINFEKDQESAKLFHDPNPTSALKAIEAYTGLNTSPAKSFLFLDEIQAAPQLLSNLRWFSEELPELPVASVGSLLDCVLANHTFSMPVGRVRYLYMEPFSFEEFLSATGCDKQRQFLAAFHIGQDRMPPPIHQKLLGAFRDYLIIGGMPDVVSK